MQIGKQLSYNGPIGYFQQREGSDFIARIDAGIITFTVPIPGVGQAAFDLSIESILSFNATSNFGSSRSQAISVDDTSLASEGNIIFINDVPSDARVQKIIDSNVIVTSMSAGFIHKNPLNIISGDKISFGTESNFTSANDNLPANNVYFNNRNLIAEIGGIITGNPGTDATGPLVIDVQDWFATYQVDSVHQLNQNDESPSVYYHVTVQTLTDLSPDPPPPPNSNGSLELVGNSSLNSEAAHNAGLITRSDYLDGSGNNISLDAAAVGFLSSDNVMNAIQKNANNRADLGAWLNRLDYTLDNLQTLSTNLADGISRIVDTDYAAETSNLTRTQILQQAATSMLAQANQMPNVILTLLK
jgi:flagellin-like hook-associated protein FlgL